MTGFVPEKPQEPGFEVPFFEDVTAKDVPGRALHLTVAQYQRRIQDLLLKLGAGAITFMPGTFPTLPKRYGYQIAFSLNGIPGRLDCAALPMRAETPKKKDRALAQALYLLGNWLEAEVLSAVYRPGAIALVPYLIGPNGRTVTEELVERQSLPALSPYYLPPPRGEL